MRKAKVYLIFSVPFIFYFFHVYVTVPVSVSCVVYFILFIHVPVMNFKSYSRRNNFFPAKSIDIDCKHVSSRNYFFNIFVYMCVLILYTFWPGMSGIVGLLTPRCNFCLESYQRVIVASEGKINLILHKDPISKCCHYIEKDNRQNGGDKSTIVIKKAEKQLHCLMFTS